jgi:succinyl-CoA synthetase beta subunit
LDSGPAAQLAEIMEKVWELFWEMDCELLEINPLVRTNDGGMLAIDAKVVIDDDASYRHPEVAVDEARTPLEAEAKAKGLSLVQLDGDVGVIANGAGLTMATLDVLALHGARGGVFLDLGGTDDKMVVQDALALVAKAKPRAVLVNIFGGITKCDTVAEGIIEAKGKMNLDFDLVVRVRGVNEAKARKMLQENGIQAMHELDEACAQAAGTRRG